MTTNETPTPRTDALRLKMAQLGWPSDGEPVAMLMASHGQLERELSAERVIVAALRELVTSDHESKESFIRRCRQTLETNEAGDPP